LPALEFVQRPAKHPLKRRIEVGDRAVLIKHKHRNGQEFEKPTVAQFSLPAYPILLPGLLLGGFQGFLGLYGICNIPGNSPENSPGIFIPVQEIGVNFQDPLLAVLARDFPNEVADVRSCVKHAVETFKGQGRIFLVHETPKTAILNLITRIP